jgi:PAS domain S-box-containing protein
VNERFCSLLGYTREELFELPWPALTHPEDVERDLSLFRDVLSGKREEYSLDKRYVRKDGSIVHCQLSVGCVRGLDSQIEYFIALIQDISERVNAETELRFQKNFLRQIIDTNPSLIFTKNSVGKFTLVNQAVADIYATTVHDLIGKSDADFNNDHSQLQQFAAEDKLVLDHSIVRSIKEEPVTDARTGETRWFQTIKKPLPDPATGGSQVLGVATDITERKRAEEQALALQQQLHHSQKLEAIGQLASGIAHDLNNALSAVVGHLQLIQMEAQHAGIQQSVSIALTGCERASSLINQLLGFARHGRGDIKPVNLPNLTRETLSFLERVVGPDISIMLTGAETPLMVLADAAQMQQALTNLIINACQAMPNGGKLSISFKKQFCHQGSLKNRLAVAGEYAVIQVKDTGIGMSKATLEKIFEPFFTTKGESNGTGLGLFTVFGMVQHLHGWLEVESELNKGTEFSIYLPIATVTSESIDNVSQPLAPQHVVRPHRLMIVDDEQVLLDLSLDFFRRAGFTCQNFNDPLVALEWYKTHSHEIDYVILDLKMPKMDGAVLFEELKKINPCIRGVILSGYIRETTLSALQALGVSKIFTKPLKLDALLRWIQQDEQHCVVSLKSTN